MGIRVKGPDDGWMGVQGVKYLVSTAFVSKLLTFALNNVVLRYTSPEIMGFANVQLDLLYNTILVFARDGFRIALMRAMVTSNDGKERQKYLNTARLPIVVALVPIVLTLLLYSCPHRIQYGQTAVYIYLVASLIELAAEPMFISTQIDMELHYRVRASAEVQCSMTRTVVVALLTIIGHEFGVLAFALGQLMGSIALFLAYYRNSVASTQSASNIDIAVARLAFVVTGQSIFKHILSEGDKMIVARWATGFNQGVFAVVNNYGSLLARVLFQPLEEFSRTNFSSLTATTKKSSNMAAVDDFFLIARFYALLSLFTLFLVPIYSDLILWILAGPRYLSQGSLPLKLYGVYIPIMAFNGITEAFVSSVARESDLIRQSKMYLVSSIIFGVAGWLFLVKWNIGTAGVLATNCVNLTFRALWSANFMQSWAHQKGLHVQWMQCLPRVSTIALASQVGLGCYVIVSVCEGIVARFVSAVFAGLLMLYIW